MLFDGFAYKVVSLVPHFSFVVSCHLGGGFYIKPLPLLHCFSFASPVTPGVDYAMHFIIEKKKAGSTAGKAVTELLA